MSAEPYRTVPDRGEATLHVRGSRFLATVDHVETVEEAETIVTEIGREHEDATHVVPAYRIRADPFREYATDDGEPSGSAGDPMLGVLRGEELENVLAVVVRYYGGTNLGIGGLVRSYQGAVTEAIEDVGVVERRPRRTLTVRTSYDDSGTVRGILEGSEATFTAHYSEDVAFDVTVPVDTAAELRDRVLGATSGRADLRDR